MEAVLDRLWIGSTHDFQSPLGALGFSGVLDLRDGQARIVDESVAVFRLSNRDGDPWTEEQVLNALDFVAKRIQRGRVLIGCAAGMSRSVCMTIGYLVRCGWDEAAAYERVRLARPTIAPLQKMLYPVLAVVRA